MDKCIRATFAAARLSEFLNEKRKQNQSEDLRLFESRSPISDASAVALS